MKHLPHLEKSPQIHPSVYVDPTARINGDVVIGAESSVWFSASIRGDVHWIRIGARTSIQDNCALHCTHDTHPLDIGDEVVVGHGAALHGCRIEDGCLIGINSTILDGAVVGAGSIVGAGALVPPGKIIPPGSMVLGTPGRVVRQLSPEELQHLGGAWRSYVDYVAEYRRQGRFHGWAEHPLQDR